MARERLFGYPESEALGTRVSDLIIPVRLRAAHEAGLRRHLTAGVSAVLDSPFDMPAVCRDGREIRVELVVTRSCPERYVGVMRELTAPTPVPCEVHLAATFHRALLELLPIMVTVVDPDGGVRWASPASIAGGAIRAGTGRPSITELASALSHPADRSAVQELLRRALAGTPNGSAAGTDDGLGEPLELRVQPADGSRRMLSLHSADLLAEPAVHGVAFYATDITRARDAERRQRIEAARLTALIESLNVGVLLQDEQQHVVLTNSAFVEMFALGLSPERLRGSAPRRPRSARVRRPRSRRAAGRRGGPARPAVIGDEVVLGDGRVLERDYLPITLDGTTLGHLWVFHDVTAQAEIRRGLEDRNRILTELSALKTEFVRVASHELRTPLTSIATFAGMLDAPSTRTRDSASRRRGPRSRAIRRNAERMLLLVEDLLLLAKLESRRARRWRAEPVDLAALVRAACASAQPPAGRRSTCPAGRRSTATSRCCEELFATAVGVVAAAAEPGRRSTVSASCAGTAARPAGRSWSRRRTSEPATAERLLSTRLPHPTADRRVPHRRARAHARPRDRRPARRQLDTQRRPDRGHRDRDPAALRLPLASARAASAFSRRAGVAACEHPANRSAAQPQPRSHPPRTRPQQPRPQSRRGHRPTGRRKLPGG